MPGRLSLRTSTASRVSRKSSVPSLDARASTVPPNAVIPEEGPPTVLRTRICDIFADAQKTIAGHRKLVISLRKIHEACCYEPAKIGKKTSDEFDEDAFNSEFARCVTRLVLVKKTEEVGDRLVRFLGLFLRHASDKDAALVPEESADDTQSFSETPSTRLTSHILSMLLPMLQTKEKTVRYRATQIVSHIINSLEAIDDDCYHLVRTGLLKRVRDKESTVRVQAVLGLGRLAGNEGDQDQSNGYSDSDDTNGLLEKLLDILQNDPSADVRRSLLLNLPLTPETLPFLLERARDVDPATRRALYSRLLPALGDFRHLSLSMREKLLRWGLRDRDEHVRKATAKLFRERWIEDCARTRLAPDDPGHTEASLPSIEALIELLERIDVVNSGMESGIALEALEEFWDGRPDYRDAINFEDPVWDHLSAESSFLARTFNDFCRKHDGHEAMVEEKMPEVTKLAFILQRNTNTLIERLRRNNVQSEPSTEQDTVEQEFVVEQLLHIARTLDYTDEVGRRKMFALLRESLAIAELPEETTKLVVEVLRTICGYDSAGERDFCGVVLEAIAEVHDTIAADEPTLEEEEESFHSARSEISDTTPTKNKPSKNDRDGKQEQDEEKAIREIMVNMKCLHIAQCMLQNIGDKLQDNVHLVTMLNNLVVPAVRSHEAPIRELGLHCLGLCCLLDKNLAEENLSLFLHCFNKGHDALQVTAIHILSDILMTHPGLLDSSDATGPLQKPIFKVLSKGLRNDHAPDVQSAATTALCKLMLISVISDEDLLKQLVICFFEPATKDNAATRQALSYFLPVYCHSRRENMARMSRVVLAVIHSLLGMGEELDEDEEMVGMTVVANMLVDWTDARKLVVQDTAAVSWDEAGKKEPSAINGDIHLELAEDLLERVMAAACSKEERKVIISMLGKLYITTNSSRDNLQLVLDLVTDAIDTKVAPDAPSRNSLTKLQTALVKGLGNTENGKKGSTSEGMTVLADEEAAVPAQASEEEAKMKDVIREEDVGRQDSVLEEPLSGEDL